MAVLELKKGLSDAKAGKPIHFAFVKGQENRLLMSKTKIPASEVNEAKKECKGSKIFVGQCGGLDENGKVYFFVDQLGEDQEDQSLAKLIEKEAAAAKVTLKVHAKAAPTVDPLALPTSTPVTVPTEPVKDTDQLYFESKMPQIEIDYQKALATTNDTLKKQMEVLYLKAKKHGEAKEYRKANETLGVLSLAIGKAQPTLPGAKPIEMEDTSTTSLPKATPHDDFDAKLKEVQIVLAECLKTKGFDPEELKSLQKMLKQAAVHKAQKDYDAGSDMLAQLLVAARKGLSTAASKPEVETPKDESTEAKVERVLKARVAKREHDKVANRIAVDSIIAAMPPEIDLLAVRAIMAEHAKKIPNEDKAFAGMRFFDDVMLIKDPAKRVTKLKEIHAAMADARDRKIRMAIELRKLPKPENDEQRKATADANGLYLNMTNHIPDWWQSNWSDDFQERIRVLSLDPEEKKKELIEAKKGFGTEDQERQKASFTKAIDPRSLKGIEAHDSYFDELTTAVPTEELQELAVVTQDLLKKARQIRDAGGTFADVREALSHIPETWWPAELLDYLQAWRKVERELLEERVREQFEPGEDEALDTVEGAINFVAGALELYSGTEWMKAPAVTGIISSFVSSVSGGFGLGKGWGEAVTKGEFETFDLKAIEEFGDNALETVSTFFENISSLKDNLEKTKFAIPEKSVLATKVLPGLAIAAAGIDLFLAIKKLGEHSAITHKTRRMISKAEEEWAKGQDEDGGAFVRALKNEKMSRALQLSKDSVEVTTASLELAGAIGEVTGIGTAAGKGIKIAGKVIEYGGKVVFTRIEWGKANHAKELIKQAQAGNPVARIQIMEDCNLYAKMYIAILVRDGHPKGKEFIEQRGLEEGDLTQSMSLKVLREAMLESADAKDETQIKDNLAEAMLEGVGGGFALTIGGKVGELAVAIRNKYVDRNVGVYDPAWKHNGAKVSLVREGWDSTKSEAFTKGLHDELTGIGAALDKAQTALLKVDFKKKPNNTKVNISLASDALKDVYQRMNGYYPLTAPQGEKKDVLPHKGMTVFVVEMKNLVFSSLNQLDDLLVERGDRDPGWKTDKAALNANEWKSTWKDAVNKAMLADDDHGVEEALKAAHAALTDKALNNKKDKAGEREARIRARDAFIDLAKALDACWASVGDCQGMRDYLMVLKTGAAQNARVMQKMLFGDKWDDPSASMADDVKFSGASWNQVWSEACKDGVVQKDKGDAGVGAAFVELESKKTAALKAASDPKKLLAARQELSQAFTKVFVAATKFVGLQKEAVKEVQLYASYVVRTAQQGVQATGGEMAAIKFKETAGFDAAGWKATYAAAILAGALPEAKGLAGGLESAFRAYSEALTKFTTEKGPKEKRVLAHTLKAKLGALQTAINKMSAADGYADHDVMGKYLTGLETELGKRMQDKDLTAVIEGSAPTTFKAQTWAWTKDGWLIAKNAAVEAGLFDPANTGFTGFLQKAETGYQAWKDPNSGDKKNAAATARKQLRDVIRMAQEFGKATKNATWKGYFKEGVKQAEARIEEMKND